MQNRESNYARLRTAVESFGGQFVAPAAAENRKELQQRRQEARASGLCSMEYLAIAPPGCVWAFNGQKTAKILLGMRTQSRSAKRINTNTTNAVLEYLSQGVEPEVKHV